MEARSREFMSLVQGERFVVEYEAKFLKLSRYASDYDKSVRFEEVLQYEFWVLIAPQRE